MGFEVFKNDKKNKTGFAVFSQTPRNDSLTTGMAGTTITKAPPAPAGTSIAGFRQLDQASKGPTKPYTPTKTIGENIFLVNALPIKQSDPFPKKVGKGLVNAAFSTLEAPTEALRHVSILGGDVLTGKGVQPIPKNTSFVEDILPGTLSKPIKGLSEKHPFLGTGVQMGLEVISDPTIMMGVGVGKTMLSPEALSPGRLAKGRKAVEELPESFDFLNDIAEPVPPRPADFTVDPLGNATKGRPLQALPSGTKPLALPPGRQPLALPGGEPKMLNAGQNWEFGTGYPKEGYWFADPFGVVRGTPETALALPEGLPTSPEVRFGDPRGQVHYPSSEFTRNAQHVKALEGKYKKIVNDEIASMKNEVGGVIRYRPGEGAPLLRASMNPKWYRDFYAANGRAPRAGEMRDMAIERLIRGNPETGEPPSEEFLGILSELSRGRKMPEEWHGLTRSMREMEATGEPELRPLIGEMSRRRAGLEPSGLNRNLGKLTDMENSIRRRTRMADEADFGQYGDVRFKRTQDQDLAILRDAMTDRVGPFRIGKVDLAPEAFQKPDFKAAQTIADKLGLRLVAFKGTGHRGMQQGRTIYLNQNMKDPLDYVFWHEVGHTMEVTHPQHYDNLMGIALEHMKDADGLLKHYKEFGYAMEDMPHEFAADVFAEALHTPGFFARVAEQAPEMLKPLLEAIDNLIANIRSMVSKDDTVMPYLKDLETLRTRIHKEVAEPYFRDAMGEKEFVDTFGKKWTAAKAKVETAKADPTNTPEFRKWFGDSKVVDESGKPIKVYHGTSNGGFTEFDPQKIPKEGNYFGKGFYFTNKKNVAKTYETKGNGETPQTLTTYLSLKNPLDIDANGEAISREFINYLKENNERVSDGMDWWFTDEARKAKGKNYNQFLTSVAAAQNEGLFQTFLRNKGYDGITHIGGKLSGGPKHQVYVAFSPTQIKSIYNRGTWDPTNPDIRYKLNQTSPLDDLKSMVEYGAANLRGGRASFEKAIRQQFGGILEGYSPEVQSRLLNNIWLHSKQLADKGQTTIKMGSDSLPVARGKGGMTFNPLGKQNTAQGQIRGNTVAFPQDSPLPKTSGDNLGRSPFSKSQVAGIEERGVSRNIRTDKARPDELRDAISENPMTYDPLANKETLSKAQAIYADGLEPSVTKLNELLKDMKPEAAPLAKMIADDLTKMGQVDRAREILSNAAVRATEAGQFGQAFRILREADPQSFLMTMDKQLLKMNKQGRELYGKKWKQIDLTDAEKEAIAKLKKGDQQAYDDLMNTIGERIANEMPSTALEKFDSWRRMAMLLNPKTHIRNIGGNIIMMGLRKSADSLAAGLEKTFLKPGQRTKSFGWSRDKNLVDIVNRDWEAIAKDFTGEKVTLKNLTSNLPSYGRWDIENMRALNREKRIFKSDLLEKGSNISRNTLSAEDYFFKERAYKDALGGYMKSNNLTEVSDAAREYAKRRALEATYQDANMVATWLNKVKSSGGIGGKLVEAAIPFVKTPTNLVKRSIEYSPVGLLRLLSNKNQNPAMAIEVLAQGLTGTAVAGLGYQLANMGWIRAERSTSRNAEALMQEAGDQPYSFITPIGSYTFDWAQPIAVPLFMGVALYESLMKQDKIDPDTVAESIASGGDTIFNLSMLQNVKQLLGGGFGSVTEQIAGLPVSYIEQAYPTIFGQVARTVDDTKRSTYDTSGMGRFGRQLAAKTPFASKLLEPRLDIWGNEQKQGGVAQQFLNPGYALPKSNDRATQEMVRLYRSTKETAFLPKSFKGSFTVNGEQVRLTPKQLTAFQRDMGQANYKEISQAIRTTEYQKASDENKVKIIRKIVQGNYDDAKQEYMDKMGIESGKSAKESKTWKAGW